MTQMMFMKARVFASMMLLLIRRVEAAVAARASLTSPRAGHTPIPALHHWRPVMSYTFQDVSLIPLAKQVLAQTRPVRPPY